MRVRHLCFLPLLLLVSLTGRLPLAVMPVVVRPTAPSAMIALAVIILAYKMVLVRLLVVSLVVIVLFSAVGWSGFGMLGNAGAQFAGFLYLFHGVGQVVPKQNFCDGNFVRTEPRVALLK